MDKWESLLKKVEEATADIEEPFFRGHGNTEWQLVPSLGSYRHHGLLENQLYYDFLTFGAPLLPANPNPWDVLFVMRHHNLPTRLLDWTQSFSVALYFAVRSFDKKGAIWILDPYRMNKSTTGDATILHPQSDLEHTYYDYFVADSARRFPNRAVAILPNKTTQRIIAQRGVFTLHRDPRESLESICSKALTKIEFDKNIYVQAQRFLKLAGLTEYSLFPDLDGLSRWLHESHDLEKILVPRVSRHKSKRKSRKKKGQHKSAH